MEGESSDTVTVIANRAARRLLDGTNRREIRAQSKRWIVDSGANVFVVGTNDPRITKRFGPAQLGTASGKVTCLEVEIRTPLGLKRGLECKGSPPLMPAYDLVERGWDEWTWGKRKLTLRGNKKATVIATLVGKTPMVSDDAFRVPNDVQENKRQKAKSGMEKDLLQCRKQGGRGAPGPKIRSRMKVMTAMCLHKARQRTRGEAQKTWTLTQIARGEPR